MNANKPKSLAVYPGTFDPTTNGHISLIERALHLFDEVIVAVASSGAKGPLFDADERLDLMKTSIAEITGGERVKVLKFDGLLATLVDDLKAQAIIRGLRAISDFEYEFQMALMNRRLVKDVETVFLMPALSWVYLSSTIVKDVARHGGDIAGLVPIHVELAIKKKIAGSKKE